MRMLWGTLALMAAGTAGAKDVEYQRGDYRFAVGPAPAFVMEQSVPDAWNAKAPGAKDAPWRFWLSDEQVDRRTGHDEDYFDYVFEVRDASLLGEAGRYKITFNPGYQRLVIHRVQLRRDGKWQERLVPERISLARREEDFDQDMADGNVTALIVLDDVRVNDAVRVSYSVVGSNPILAGQIVDWNRLGWNSPILNSRMRVLYDPGTHPAVHTEHDAPAPVIRTAPDATEVLFAASNVPAYTDEGAYPIWYQPYPTTVVSQSRRWADVVGWALPLYPQPGRLPDDLEARLAQWSKLPDPYERIKVALREVQEQVRYFGVEMGENTHKPNAPADTWNRRYGDCKDKAYLLATLLGRMGVQASPALVSTTQGRAIADVPPAASLFDHVIVRAQVGKEKLWLDPTLTSEGGDPRDRDLSAYGVALPIAMGVDALDTIAPPEKSQAAISVSEKYEPDANGREVRLTVATTYRGQSANQARRSFAGARIEEISRRYAEYYRKRFGDLTVVSMPSMHDDRDGNQLEVAEQYVLKSPFETDGGGRALEVYGEALSNAAQLPDSIERTSPLNVGVPTHYRHEIEVDLPERWTSSLGDETVDYESDAFRYQRKLTVQSRKLDLLYDMDVLAREVPANKVAVHLGELRKVRDDLSARLPLQSPDPGRQQERDARLKALLRTVIEGQSK